LDCAAVEDRGGRLQLPVLEKSNDHSQVVRDLLENSRVHPPASLLVDSGLRRKIVGKVSPLTTSLDHVAYCVEKVAQGMFALRRILAHQAQVREKKLPFAIRDVAWVRLPCRVRARQQVARRKREKWRGSKKGAGG
jgi:hypothetical protein